MAMAPWDLVPDPTDYDNADRIPDGAAYFDRWSKDAADFRDQMGDNGRLGLIYGDHPREAFDLFLTGNTPRGLFVFVHGGFWRMTGRETWSHLAAGAVAAGWAAALPSYPLCPEVRIGDITRSVTRAVTVAASYVAGPIVLAGHSAGGHLVLRLAHQGLPRLAGVISISPLSDLAPLRHLPLNADWQITPDESASESPRRTPAPDLPVEIVVGGAERPAFVDQARWMADAWPHAALTEVEGRHHFDIVDPLTDLSAPWIASHLTST